MDVSDDEIRALVREALAKKEAGGFFDRDAPSRPIFAFALLPLSRGDGDGACLIEPAVHCNHCGYCLSYGH